MWVMHRAAGLSVATSRTCSSPPAPEMIRRYAPPGLVTSIGKVHPDVAMKTIWFYLAALILGLVAIALVPGISLVAI